jgi:hypothetical protein
LDVPQIKASKNENARFDEKEAHNFLLNLPISKLSYMDLQKNYSFYLKNRNKVFPRQFDHCFASEPLNPVEFNYLHEPREQKLSDHSAVEVIFSPKSNKDLIKLKE